jgi:predicted extracellular nuclease
MLRSTRLRSALATALLIGTSSVAGTAAAVEVGITEWQYNGSEYVEFTNLSLSVIDFFGWSFDDNSRTPGSVSLSAIGMVAPGESVLLVETDAAAFRTLWNLPLSVKIVELNTNNLGRNDEINLYNNLNALVDRLTYNDQGTAGGPQTLNIGGNPLTLAALDADTAGTGWILSQVGDAYGSYTSATGGFIGNPGIFIPPVPLPAALPLLLSGILGFAVVRKRSTATVANA